jgi:hypothetical protein
MIIVALAMITANVFGAIRETPDQFESKKPTHVAVNGNYVECTWAGKTVTHVGVFKHGTCRLEIIYYTDHRPMTDADIMKFLKPYSDFAGDEPTITDDGITTYLYNKDGTPYAMIFYSKREHTLSVTSRVVMESQHPDKWRALPNETAWQWIVHSGYCNGDCSKKASSGPVYWNWDDAHDLPLMDNWELEPNEPLLMPYPFMAPKPDDPLYDATAETEITNKTMAYPSQVVRFYRRGVFIGYKVIPAAPNQQQQEDSPVVKL